MLHATDARKQPSLIAPRDPTTPIGTKGMGRGYPREGIITDGYIAMKTMIVSALALFIAMPTIASAAEADVIITTHVKIINDQGQRLHHRKHGTVAFYDHGRRHHRPDTVIINDQGQRLHHRKHGTVAFYDHGRRHHRPDTVIVTGSIERRHHRHHHPVIIQDDSDY